MKTSIWLPLVAATAAPAIAAAQSDQSSDAVVVTATRIAQTTDESLVPVSVLTREEIERSAASTLPELLRKLPGVDFSVSGGPGKTASLYMRGTNSGHTLVLVDGVRAGSATLGSFPFEQIPLAQIERIEVVRGPRSALYGSEAIGGVIQIFTRKGQPGTHGHARVGAGNHGTRDTAAGVSWGDEQTQVGVNLAYYSTDGIDVRDGVNEDNDGYDNRSLTLNLSQQLSDRVSADLTALRIDSENQYDDPFNVQPADDHSDNLQQTLGLRLRGELSEGWELSGGVNEHRDEADSVDSNPSFIKTKRRGADIKSDHYLSDDQILTLGADYYREQVSNNTTALSDDERKNKAVFAQWQAQYGNLGVLVGGRHDDSDTYGRENTGNLNLGYQVAPGHRVLASVGTAFKAPTFNDLYWPDTGFTVGNPNLVPEKSKSYELGYEGRARSTTYATRFFYTEVDNLIEWAPGLGGKWSPTNVSEAAIRGVELELATEIAGWQASGNLTLLDTDDRSDGSQLENRAERSLGVDLGRRYGSVSWLLSFLAQDERVSGGSTLPGYGILDLKADYAIDQHWGLEAKIANLTDKAYQTKSGFDSLDRTCLLSLTYRR